MRTFQNDMTYGMEKEMSMLSKLSQHFIEYGKITNTKDLYQDPYHKYDFEAEDGTTFELKSRRNKKKAYPTTILPFSKIVPDAIVRLNTIRNYGILFKSRILKRLGMEGWIYQNHTTVFLSSIYWK